MSREPRTAKTLDGLLEHLLVLRELYPGDTPVWTDNPEAGEHCPLSSIEYQPVESAYGVVDKWPARIVIQ